MIRSMTGFGRFEFAGESHKIIVEMKSVNHRYLDLSIKMPKIFNCFETAIRSLVKEQLQRGKVDMYISYETESDDQTVLCYHEDIARDYMTHMAQMADTFNLENNLTLTELARMPEVFTMEQRDTDAKELWPDVEQAVRQACVAMVQARQTEGEQLKKDLLLKLDHMDMLVDMVTDRAPVMVQEYRIRLTEKVKEFIEASVIDENRIAAEVTLYADKICVDEEMVRLRTHISHMKEALCTGGSVGRKLDFLAQEMNREANTTLSKINDVTLADVAIDMKTEIEKIREQVQNIE